MTALAAIYDRLDELTMARTCPYCQATPLQPCRTRPGRRRIAYAHSARSADLWEAYRLGMERQRLAEMVARS